MAVEVNHRNWPVRAVDGPQKRQCDGVVAAQGDDTGECLALLRGAKFVCVGGRVTGEDAVVTFFNLVESPRIVISAPGLVNGYGV